MSTCFEATNSALIEKKKAIIFQTKQHTKKKIKFETKILPKITIAGFFICEFLYSLILAAGGFYFVHSLLLSLLRRCMRMNGWCQILEKWTKATVEILPVRKHIRALVEKDPHIKVFINKHNGNDQKVIYVMYIYGFPKLFINLFNPTIDPMLFMSAWRKIMSFHDISCSLSFSRFHSTQKQPSFKWRIIATTL